MAKHLRCFMMRYRMVDREGVIRRGTAAVIHRDQQAATDLLADDLMGKGTSVTISHVAGVAIVEGAYLVRGAEH